LEFSNVLKGQDMQVGAQIGGTEDPKLAAMRAQAAAANAPPARSPAPERKMSTGSNGGPPPMPVGFKPPGSSGSYRSNASDKKMSARAAAKRAEIDAVRDLPM